MNKYKITINTTMTVYATTQMQAITEAKKLVKEHGISIWDIEAKEVEKASLLFKAYVVSPVTKKWVYGTITDEQKKHTTFYFIADDSSFMGYVKDFVKEEGNPIDIHNKLKEKDASALL